jgi:hypothetical protein
MRRTTVLWALILSLAAAPAALAGLGPGGVTFQPPATTVCAGQDQVLGEEASAERLIVTNPQGTALGEIVNFLVDTDIGKVAYALLDTGGSQEMQDMRLVPVSALVVEYHAIILNMDRQQLANAPTPRPGQDPEEFHRQVSDFYGVAPYWEE